MILSLRAYFLGRALREKLLLLAFIGMGALWWLSAFSGRSGKFWGEQRATTTRLTEQAQWIKNKTSIEQTAAKTAGRLDPAKTLNGNQLVTTVAQLANEAGLRQTSTNGNAVTTASGQFALHSVEYTIRNLEWDSLGKFYEALLQRSPYIAVERFVLNSAPNNPAQLTLVLRVVSVEIVP
jgi:DNA gyrase inhibitor GyrI